MTTSMRPKVSSVAHVALQRHDARTVLFDFLGGGEDGAGQLRMRLDSLRGDDDVPAFSGEFVSDGLADAA